MVGEILKLTDARHSGSSDMWMLQASARSSHVHVDVDDRHACGMYVSRPPSWLGKPIMLHKAMSFLSEWPEVMSFMSFLSEWHVALN